MSYDSQPNYYRVSEFSTPADALAAFGAAPQAFDLIVTDYTMPGTTGLEFARVLRGIRADMPVIICTGRADSVDARTVREMGISNIVTKPFNVIELGDVVSKALGEDCRRTVS